MTDASPADARAARPCTDERYGLPEGGHPSIQAWADEVEAILDAHDLHDVPEHVAQALGMLLGHDDLLLDGQQEPDPDWYRKHLLYADPQGRFTLLALVWLPGQGTVIHGHTAWCSVGVYRGKPNVVCYDCTACDEGKHTAVETQDQQYEPGALCAVRPGLADVHRIYNATDETMITLHAYGCDLVDDPDAINLDLHLTA